MIGLGYSRARDILEPWLGYDRARRARASLDVS